MLVGVRSRAECLARCVDVPGTDVAGGCDCAMLAADWTARGRRLAAPPLPALAAIRPQPPPYLGAFVPETVCQTVESHLWELLTSAQQLTAVAEAVKGAEPSSDAALLLHPLTSVFRHVFREDTALLAHLLGALRSGQFLLPAEKGTLVLFTVVHVSDAQGETLRLFFNWLRLFVATHGTAVKPLVVCTNAHTVHVVGQVASALGLQDVAFLDGSVWWVEGLSLVLSLSLSPLSLSFYLSISC